MKSIGKYEVLGEIGTSAAGTTYRVRDTFRKRELALKVLHPLPTLDAASKDEFYRQLSLCADLTHRHLAKIVDMGEVDARIYIATELISGSDLRDIIAGDRELTVAQKIGILAQVCEGLAFAHSRDIAHGDIKPANIFVDANNDVTILDLGTAKWQSLIMAAGAPPEGVLPNYFAPEQVLGQRFDSKSDLFSLAVVAYEFLSGKYPFQVPVSLVPREIVHSEPESLRKLAPGLPEEVEKLLVSALKKKPEERLQTAEEFASGLYRIAQQLRRAPSAPVPESVPESVSAPVAVPMSDRAPAAPETPAPLKMPEPEVKTPRRQDVQAASTQEQPWTARSYVATPLNRSEEKATPLPQPSVPEATGQPAAPAAPTRSSSPAPPAYPRAAAETTTPPLNVPPRPGSVPQRPASRLPNRMQRKPAQAKPLTRRVVAVALGAVLAIYVVVSYVSHQGLRASQKAISPNPAVASKTATPEFKRNSERVTIPEENTQPVVNEPSTDVEPPQAEPRAQPKTEQILRKLKTVWESGNYSEAMRLVDEVLAANPANSEARAWKKRIRAAQEAEAAIK